MLPEIGLMIGAYIVVRMLDLIFRPIVPFQGFTAVLQVVLKIGAAVCVAIAVFISATLLLQGTDTTLPGLK